MYGVVIIHCSIKTSPLITPSGCQKCHPLCYNYYPRKWRPKTVMTRAGLIINGIHLNFFQCCKLFILEVPSSCCPEFRIFYNAIFCPTVTTYTEKNFVVFVCKKRKIGFWFCLRRKKFCFIYKIICQLFCFILQISINQNHLQFHKFYDIVCIFS